MADLSEVQASQSVKIAGANPSTGVEDNFLEVDSLGKITTKLNDGSGNSITLGQKNFANSVPVVVASDNISSLNFASYTNLINIGTVETAFYYFKNPIGSGKTVTFHSINLVLNGGGTGRLYVNPTVTANGTSVSSHCLNIQTSPPASVTNIFSQPTVTSNGTFYAVSIIPAQIGDKSLIFGTDIILQAGQSILLTIANIANNTPSAVGTIWTEI